MPCWLGPAEYCSLPRLESTYSFHRGKGTSGPEGPSATGVELGFGGGYGHTARWLCTVLALDCSSSALPESKWGRSTVVRIRTGAHPINSRGLCQIELQRLASRYRTGPQIASSAKLRSVGSRQLIPASFEVRRRSPTSSPGLPSGSRGTLPACPA